MLNFENNLEYKLAPTGAQANSDFRKLTQSWSCCFGGKLEEESPRGTLRCLQCGVRRKTQSAVTEPETRSQWVSVGVCGAPSNGELCLAEEDGSPDAAKRSQEQTLQK